MNRRLPQLLCFIGLLVVIVALSPGSLAVAQDSTGTTSRVSVSSAGEQANGDSYLLSISADGLTVAFDSYASNLVSGDTNGGCSNCDGNDVFVHDRQTGDTILISRTPSGDRPNHDSWSPSLSADGRFVAFASWATNLVATDSNGYNADIFVNERLTGETTLVSVSSDGMQGDGEAVSPDISADGRFVAFTSWATNLVAGDTNDRDDIFVHDRQTGDTSRVSVSSTGAQANGSSGFPAISADGRYVAFSSHATNLVANDTNGFGPDVFVHDRQTGDTTIVSAGSYGAPEDDVAENPAISADGRIVAFITYNPYGGAPGNVFVHDTQTGDTTIASVSSEGAPGNGEAHSPALSADGRVVAFSSYASNLVAGDTNGQSSIYEGVDVFVHDRETGVTSRVSLSSVGAQGDNWSDLPALSADGQIVAFASAASTLVAGDTNGDGSSGEGTDIFVHVRNEQGTPVYSISGRVTNAVTGDPIDNVTLWLDSIMAAGTNSSGNYTFTDVPAGEYTLSIPGYDTTPASRTVTVPPDAVDQDFAVTPIMSSISGQILDQAAAPVSGVEVCTQSGACEFTGVDGAYSIHSLAQGTYSLSANKTDYTFSPSSIEVAVPPNAVDQDFTATPIVSSISGRVTDPATGDPLGWVVVMLDDTMTVQTNGTGDYTFTNVSPGEHTVTIPGYTTTPLSRIVTVPPDATGQDFTATPTAAIQLVSQIGGIIRAVDIQGNLAYIGQGPRLTVLDISDPGRPVVIGESQVLPGVFEDLAVAGDYAYLTSPRYDAGWHTLLYVIDVSNPADPTWVSTYDVPGHTNDLAVDGTQAYMATNGAGLRVLDIADPAAPVPVSSIGGHFEGVAAADNVLYTSGNEGLQIFDVSNPAVPLLTGTALVNENTNALAVAGGVAYVATGGNNAPLYTIDVSDPATPSVLGHYDMHVYAHALVVAGDRAYVAADEAGLQILDVSDPTALFEVGRYDSALPQWHTAMNIAVAGDYAYVADRYGLRILDVGGVTPPTPMGSLDTPGQWNAIATQGSFAYVADEANGLRIINIADSDAPVEVGNIDTPGQALGVAVSGNYAYVADSDDVRVIDVSDPANPNEATHITTPAQAENVTVAGDHLYVASGDEGLSIADITDPENPVLVGNLDTPGYAVDVAVAGTIAYVAAASGGLRVISVANPAVPEEIGSYEEYSYPIDVAVAGDLAYVLSSSRLLIFNVADPTTPTLVGEFRYDQEKSGLAVSGNDVYLSGNGVSVIDVSDPTRPAETGNFLRDSTTDIAIAGGYSYITTYTGDLRILDNNARVAPAQATYYHVVADAADINVVGDYVFVADYASGLAALDIADAAAPAVVDYWAERGEVFALDVADEYAFVIDMGYLHVLDISDPARLTPIAKSPLYASDIAVRGAFAYVAIDGEVTALSILDVSNPATPTVVGSVPLPNWANDLAVAGDYAYAATGNAGLRIIDISQPEAPVAVSSFDPADPVWEVMVAGNYAYLANEQSGLRVLDISDPAAPVEVARLRFSDRVLHLGGDGRYLWLAVGNSNGWGTALRLIDVSDPTAPIARAYYPLPSWANGMVAAGNLAYVVDGEGGFLVVRVEGGDGDQDGQPDETEDAAPNNGDGNNDGTPDSEQDNVASLPNSNDGQYITLVAPSGTALTGVAATDSPAPGTEPADAQFPVGFLQFGIDGLAHGVATTVEILLENGTNANTYYKYGPTSTNPTDHWYEFLYDGTTGAEVLPDKIVLHFVDGQRGDGDLMANGDIEDPGAPAVMPPAITAFTPTSGPAGTVVSITGTTLAGATSVKFNGTPASFTVASATQIYATVPAEATTGKVAVTTPSGTAISAGDFTVTASVPTIAGFSPTSGPIGTAVTINGTNFGGATVVKFNGTNQPTFLVNPAGTQITAAVPVGATTGKITVTAPGGIATSGTDFTVISAPAVAGFTPTSGPVDTLVTINGANFTGATAVTFNGTSQPAFAVNSATQITAAVPVGATTGKIAVTTPGGTATSAADFTVTTPPPGAIYLSPTAAGTLGSKAFTGADILSYVKTSNTWDVLYDGSYVNTPKNLGAFAFQGQDILLGFSVAQVVPGLGTTKVAPQDLVRFTPTRTGYNNTAGTFAWFFDGSDVGLTTSGEMIDALWLDAGGRLYISTAGSGVVPVNSANPSGAKIKFQDEDILRFTPSSTGSTTAGTWELYWNPTSITGMSAEDINGYWEDPVTGHRYVTIVGAFNIGNAAYGGKYAGNGTSILRFAPNAAAPGGWAPAEKLTWLAAGATLAAKFAIDGIEMGR